MKEDQRQSRVATLQNRSASHIGCCPSFCLQNMAMADAVTAVNNSAFCRSLGMQSYNMYIKACILSSLPRGDIGNNCEWDNSLSSLTIFSCRERLCLKSFMFLIGIQETKFRRLKKEALANHSIITKPHGLTGQRGEQSNKYLHQAQQATQLEMKNVCEEYAIEPPWFIPPRRDGRIVKLMPPHFNRESVYQHVREKVSGNLCLGRSSVYQLLKSESFEHITFSKKEKGLCDRCCSLKETIRGLETRTEPRSRARLICAYRELHNHTIRHRMSRYLYRMCRAKVRRQARPGHVLMDEDLEEPGNGIFDDQEGEIAQELQKLKDQGLLEEEEEFNVAPPYSPNDKQIGMISFDYARHLSIPHKSLERMQEHFASVLGYNVYLFGVVDEATSTQTNYVYGEENDSKGAHNVCSMLFDYLTKQASDTLKSSDHLLVFADNCGGENKNRQVSAFLRCFTRSKVWPNLRKITPIFMERGHTKFEPDAGFGIVRREEKNTDTETINDVVSMVNNSSRHTHRNIGVHFDSKNFKFWNHHERFRPIPRIRKQHMIQFILKNGTVKTYTREIYSGRWQDHGTLLKDGYEWPSLTEMMVDKPAPTLSKARIGHLRRTVLPIISDEARPWWDSILLEDS